MPNDSNDRKRPIRRMVLLIACLVAGAVALILIWMRNPPPGVNSATGAGAALAIVGIATPGRSGLRVSPWTC